MKNLFKRVYDGKRILITGDTGFKGSWLAIWLKELGAKVYGYALPPQGKRDNFNVCSLYEIIHHEDGDVRDLNHLTQYFESVKPEITFHLAAQPLVIESYNNPHYTFETNLMGTVNFFEAVRKTDSIKAAVNITSDKCYKNNEWLWGYRECDPMGGNDPYSASKGAAELIAHSYIQSFFSNNNRCSIASARAGNVIGGGDWAEHRIVPDYFRAIEKRETLQLRYPNATRPWQHVLEPLSGYLLLGAKLFAEGYKYSGGWNFGPLEQNNYSVKELVERIIGYTGQGNFTVPDNAEKKHESSLLKLDISKAIKLLDWRPVLNFEETVHMTADGYLAESNVKNIYIERVKQIYKYVETAAERNLNWINN